MALCDKGIARMSVLVEYAKMANEAAKRGAVLVHSSQDAAAADVVRAFAAGATAVTLVAPPQWGKTGVILGAIIKLTTLADDDAMIHPDNVYILTGMSDTDWRTQTKGRMLPSMREHVLHRNQLKTLPAAFQERRDMLLVIDECHFASDDSQSLCGYLKEAGIWDLVAMRARNVRVLCVSATPGSMLLDALTWGDHHATVVADIASTPSYTSFETLLQEDRVYSFELNETNDVARLCARIVSRWPDAPRWHIIRSSKKELERCGFVSYATRHGFDVTHHNSALRIADVDEALKDAPAKHHFILIRGFWRAAATLDDRYIGVCYDKSKDYSTTAQGLGGRLCGHGRQSGPMAPMLLTNATAVREYVGWLAAGCDYFACKQYRSSSLTVVRGVLRKQKTTTMHASCVDHLIPVDVVRKSGANAAFKLMVSNADAGADAAWLTSAPEPLPHAPPVPPRACPDYRHAIQQLLKEHLALSHMPRVQIAYTDARRAKFESGTFIGSPTHYESDYWVGTTDDGVVFIELHRQRLVAFRSAHDPCGRFHTFDGRIKMAKKE